MDRGSISTPNYPHNYSPHLNCSWHVMVTPGFRISANFLSPFQVQGYGTQCSSGDYLEVTLTWEQQLVTTSVKTMCSSHRASLQRCYGHAASTVLPLSMVLAPSLLSLKVRNGPDASSPPLGPRLCGSSPPSLLQATDNHLFVHFVSDASNEGSGFRLTFEAHSQGSYTQLLPV